MAELTTLAPATVDEAVEMIRAAQDRIRSRQTPVFASRTQPDELNLSARLSGGKGGNGLR